MKDYYKILGLERGASRDEVKKAFRKLSSQYHPDKKTGDEAKFKEITEAYAVLGDEKKKAEYDTYGHAFNQAGGGAGGFGGFNWADFQQGGGFQGNGQSFEFDLNDIFEGFGFGGQRTQRGRDISIDIELQFQDAVFGIERKVLLTKNNTCTYCNGTGAKEGTEMITCTTCGGNGKIRETRQSVMGSFSTVRECNVCHGRGKVPKEKCPHCAGTGVRRSEEEIAIKIPSGIQDGEVIRMTGRGEAIPNGEPGDLYVKIHVKAHEKIRREGTTLSVELPVKLTDALLGAKYNVETLDGNVEITVPAGVRHNELLRIKDKGVPIDNRRGDFMVRIKIETPQKLSRKARKIVEELREEGI
ncbi:MAG: molecular chaperone DnaJ [Patescibacteria group bacterium]